MPAKPQTQDGLKNKGNRLSGFVRGNSDAEANYNAPAPKQVTVAVRSDTPNAAAQPEQAPPSREELAKTAKIQLPQKSRKQIVAPPAPPAPPEIWEIPNKTRKLPPAEPKPEPETQVLAYPELANAVDDEDATNRALFDGSQLGDDFMNSQITTPHNEPEDVFIHQQERPRVSQRPAHEGERAPSPELGHDHAHHQDAQRRTSGAALGRFQIEKGRLVVNHGQEQRRDRSNVRDGFNNEPLREKRRQYDDRHAEPHQERRRQHNNHYAPASPTRSARDLPIREVKVKLPRKEHRQTKQMTQGPSPYENYSRQPIDSHTTGAHEVIEVEDDGPGFDEPTQEVTPKPSKQPKRIRKQPQDTLMESAMPPSKPPGMNWNRTQQSRKRTRASLDYDDKALAQKTFADLQDEPFDHDPAHAGNNKGGNGDPLSDKLKRGIKQSEDDQTDFFSSMKINEWEESGDWLVDRFADLMKRMREARRQKRIMIAEFEEEAAEREKAVRLRSDAVDRKMERMRQDGRRVVGGDRQA